MQTGLALMEARQGQLAAQLRAMEARRGLVLEELAAVREKRVRLLLGGAGARRVDASELADCITRYEIEAEQLAPALASLAAQHEQLEACIINVRRAAAAQEEYALAFTARHEAYNALTDGLRALATATMRFSGETLPALVAAVAERRDALLAAQQRMERAALACGQGTIHIPMPELPEFGGPGFAVRRTCALRHGPP